MTTLVGLKRRGYTPKSIRDYCAEIGVTKKDSTIDMAILENAIRHDLEATAKRVFGTAGRGCRLGRRGRPGRWGQWGRWPAAVAGRRDQLGDRPRGAL